MGADSPAPRARNDTIDLLRGLVIVLMALDHARDFFTNFGPDPTLALDATTPALFVTRWVTHFCAPVFVFLAGTSAFLAGTRRSRRELARFLATRGLWLVVVEHTLVRLGWFFDPGYHIVVFQVIWVLGVSMIVLAGLVLLPLRPAHIGALGVALVVGHDALDGIHAADLGRWGWVWNLLHERGFLTPPPRVVTVIYPIIPWPGVMTAGYACGAVFAWPDAERRRFLVRLGAALTLAFIVLRAINHYGDPRPWTPQRTPLFTFFSFLACSKYPPSLDYLLMTLGPALAFLGLADGAARPWARPFVTFGRVPFFFYVTHVPLLHGAAVAVGGAIFVDKMILPKDVVSRIGYPLPVVYLAWALAVLALYPACRWFAGVKARSRAAWLSYL